MLFLYWKSCGLSVNTKYTSFLKIDKALSKFSKIHRKTLGRVNELKALYRQEVEKRRQLYNTLIEIRGNIRVYCRIRPLFNENSPSTNLFDVAEDGTISAKMPNATQRSYQFDRIFGHESMQEEVKMDKIEDNWNYFQSHYNTQTFYRA